MSEVARVGAAPVSADDRRNVMVGIAFLAQNVAIGMGFGAYGTLVATIEREFATSRALAASGLSIMAVMIGFCAPWVGGAMLRWRIRTVMMAGALACALGYGLLAFVRDIHVLLAIFALLIGPGACMLGPVPASTLVTNWVDETGRGRALGFVNMSFFVFVFPFVAAWMLGRFGMASVFLLLAGIMLAMLPLLLLVVDRPVTPTTSRGGDAQSGATAPLGVSAILRQPAFLVLALGSSLVVATGMTMVTHLVSIGLDCGLHLEAASSLLSAFGICGAAGSLLFGWVADRTSARVALAIVALAMLPELLVPMHTSAYLPLLASAALLGLCAGSIVGLQSTALGTWLGGQNFARGIGLLNLFQVPCLLGAAPLAGYLFDRTGSYDAALMLNVATLGATGGMFLLYRPNVKRVTII